MSEYEQHIKELNRARAQKCYNANADKINARRCELRAEKSRLAALGKQAEAAPAPLIHNVPPQLE
jgi:hypothetical protein